MKILLFALSVVFLFSCDQGVLNKRIDLIDQYLQGQAEFFNFNGNVLIAEKGKVLYQKSFGLADYSTGQVLNDSSVFELASVSKQFTAMGILILKGQGKLDLTDTLRHFLPELPYSNITLHHMLTHTSGLPDYFEIMTSLWDQDKIAVNQDVIDLLVKEKPEIYFEPGTQWEYCNTAYLLLASIIERVSGMTFKDFMAMHILNR